VPAVIVTCGSAAQALRLAAGLNRRAPARTRKAD
jgi:hypothetical protein